MKVCKSISLYFVYPLSLFLFGMFCGVKGYNFFYPGQFQTLQYEENKPASSLNNCLSVDTEYCVEMVLLPDQTVTSNTERLPKQYWGMNRESFLEAVRNYEEHPPLAEQEQGLVSLEVCSFAPERVVVRKQYQKEPVYYIAVKDHEIVVLLSDRKTVYIETGMQLDRLPEQLQTSIMQCYEIEGEENLYSFLENYTS